MNEEKLELSLQSGTRGNSISNKYVEFSQNVVKVLDYLILIGS